MSEPTPLKRTCECGCRRSFPLKKPRDPRRFFDRGCAARFNGKNRTTARKRVQKTTGFRDRGIAIGSKNDLRILREYERSKNGT